MGKTTLNPEGLTPPSVSHSLVTITTPGRLIFVSGSDGIRPGRQCGWSGRPSRAGTLLFEKMKRSVEAAGGTLDDIVSMTVLVTDARYFAAVNEARREIITTNFPSSTMVQVTAFGRPEMLVEMNAIAVVPDGTR